MTDDVICKLVAIVIVAYIGLTCQSRLVRWVSIAILAVFVINNLKGLR